VSVVVSVEQFLGRKLERNIGPSDGPDFCPTFCPTFRRRGNCKNNAHVGPLAGRRHGSKSAVAYFRTAELQGHRTCCCAVLMCWHNLLLNYFIKIVLWLNALVALVRIKCCGRGLCGNTRGAAPVRWYG
jgi:hypothetical protein